MPAIDFEIYKNFPAYLWDAGNYEFYTKIDLKVLRISLKIISERPEEREGETEFGVLWGIEGKVTLFSQNKEFTHLIPLFVLANQESKTISCCLDVFEKTFREQKLTENCSESIPLEEIGRLKNQNLLEIEATDQGICFDSIYLKMIPLDDV